MTLEQMKTLIRLQHTVSRVLEQAKSQTSGTSLGPFEEPLCGIIDQTKSVIGDDTALLSEFNSAVGNVDGWRSVIAVAAALDGWLEGAVDSEAYDLQLTANAEAYASERIERESRRAPGFTPST